MEQLIEVMQSVNGLLRESQEYKTYISTRNSLRTNEELYNAIMDLKNRYSDIEQFTEGNPYDELLRLYNENDELIHNSSVNEFLRAESAFSKLVRRLVDEMMKDIDFS